MSTLRDLGQDILGGLLIGSLTITGELRVPPLVANNGTRQLQG